MQDFISQYLPENSPYVAEITKFVTALLILLVGWILAKWAKRLVRIALSKMDANKVDVTLKPLMVKLTQTIILLIALLMALSFVGVPITSLVAVLAAAGLAIALALQGTLSNIASGVMLLLLRPFNVNETIDTPSVTGKVTEIGLFTTNLKTADGLFVSVPNSQLWSNRIQNVDRFPVRRININVGVAYDTNLDDVCKILVETMSAHPAVLSEPAVPEVLVEEFADSSINLLARCWLPKTNWRADASSIRIAVKKALDEANIEIPFPQRVLHQVNT